MSRDGKGLYLELQSSTEEDRKLWVIELKTPIFCLENN